MLGKGLIIAIVIVYYFLFLLVRKRFYVTKNYYSVSNTSRGFVFLLDLLMINILQLVVWMIHTFTDDAQYEVYTEFVDHAFHYDGAGIVGLILYGQLYAIPIYLLYSFICELSPMRSTVVGYFFDHQVVTSKKDSNRLVQVSIRTLLKLVSLIVLPVSFLLSYINKERKWLHDYVSFTSVVKSDNQ